MICLCKTLTYSVCSITLTAAILAVCTESLTTGITIAVIDRVAKIILYYVHERMWSSHDRRR